MGSGGKTAEYMKLEADRYLWNSYYSVPPAVMVITPSVAVHNVNQRHCIKFLSTL
jgi:hypothetical protein